VIRILEFLWIETGLLENQNRVAAQRAYQGSQIDQWPYPEGSLLRSMSLIHRILSSTVDDLIAFLLCCF
jgi:hypothetical protein